MKLFATILFVFFAASNAMGQLILPGAMLRDGPGSSLAVIFSNAAVCEDVGVSFKQAEKLRPIAQEVIKFQNEKDAHPGSDLDRRPDVRRERELLFARTDAQVEKLLNPKQLIRARQIVFQIDVAASRFDAAFKRMGLPPMTEKERAEIEAELRQVADRASRKISLMRYGMVKKAVEESSEHSANRLMGKPFGFVKRKIDPGADYDRHVLPKKKL